MIRPCVCCRKEAQTAGILPLCGSCRKGCRPKFTIDGQWDRGLDCPANRGKIEVMQKHPNADAIIAYATDRGVINARLNWRQAWELLGDGCDCSDRGWPLVWKVAEELKIHTGCANHNQVWVNPDKLVIPTPPWAREVAKVRDPDTDPPIPDEPALTPSQLAAVREKTLGDLRGALEVLPSILESLDSFTEESLLPYAKRIILATVILHNTDRKLNEGWEAADEAADEEDEGDEDDAENRHDRDMRLWGDLNESGPSEEDKERAFAEMAAFEEGRGIGYGID
jgi:hypothetical protein